MGGVLERRGGDVTGLSGRGWRYRVRWWICRLGRAAATPGAGDHLEVLSCHDIP